MLPLSIQFRHRRRLRIRVSHHYAAHFSTGWDTFFFASANSMSSTPLTTSVSAACNSSATSPCFLDTAVLFFHDQVLHWSEVSTKSNPQTFNCCWFDCSCASSCWDEGGRGGCTLWLLGLPAAVAPVPDAADAASAPSAAGSPPSAVAAGPAPC